jgi:hypothetical protein
VKGGELSIPQLVVELSRLILERWQWIVTQQDNNSFVVPFPPCGDLLRSRSMELAFTSMSGSMLRRGCNYIGYMD